MKKATFLRWLFGMSGWQDSNLRPPGPKPGAMTGLRYIPNRHEANFLGAVRAGFEPAVQFPVRQFSKLVVSASHPPHRGAANVPKYFTCQDTTQKKVGILYKTLKK
jgi:hypothetical protein